MITLGSSSESNSLIGGGISAISSSSYSSYSSSSYAGVVVVFVVVLNNVVNFGRLVTDFGFAVVVLAAAGVGVVGSFALHKTCLEKSH